MLLTILRLVAIFQSMLVYAKKSPLPRSFVQVGYGQSWNGENEDSTERQADHKVVVF